MSRVAAAPRDGFAKDLAVRSASQHVVGTEDAAGEAWSTRLDEVATGMEMALLGEGRFGASEWNEETRAFSPEGVQRVRLKTRNSVERKRKWSEERGGGTRSSIRAGAVRLTSRWNSLYGHSNPDKQEAVAGFGKPAPARIPFSPDG